MVTVQNQYFVVDFFYLLTLLNLLVLRKKQLIFVCCLPPTSFFPLVLSLSCFLLFATPWAVAHQASLSFTISRRLLKLLSIESLMPFSTSICLLLILLRFSIYKGLCHLCIKIVSLLFLLGCDLCLFLV